MNEVDQVMSHHFAARIDALRFSDTDLSSLDDDALKQLDRLFRGHMKTVDTLIPQFDHDEIITTLIKTVDLIHKHYIVPIEAEMARRWRNAK